MKAFATVLIACGCSLAAAQVAIRLPSSSGSAESQVGFKEPGRSGIGRFHDTPPALTPEQEEALAEARERAEEVEMEWVDRVDPNAPPPSVIPGPPTNPPPANGAYEQRVPGTFHVWRTSSPRLVVPGGNLSTTSEPSAASAYDQIFISGNWFAALSSDAGLTWRYINAFDNFPPDGTNDDPGAASGTFCCDQNVYYVASRDLWVWQLQYVVGGNSNVQRTVFFHGRDALENNAYCFYDWSPANFGYAATGFWLDFPDISAGTDFLYLTTNIFVVGAGSTSTCGLLRLPLTPLSTCAGFSYNYYVDTAHPGFRLAHGSTTTMYWGAHHTTASLRIYRWAENSGSIFWDDTGHTTYNQGGFSAVTNDGRNWAGNGDTRLLGAYRANGELGFMWHVPQDPGNGRPFPRTLVKRFSEATRALTGEQEVWNGSIAYMYPCVHPNASNEWGGTIHYGAGATYPSAAAWIADSYNSRSMQPMELAFVATSDGSPASNRFGDYYDSARNWLNTNTWVGTAHTINGGAARPYYTWFGREANTPAQDMDARSANAANGTYNVGQAISIAYNAANIGAQNATSVVLDFRASTNTIISSGDYPLGTLNAGTVAPGATVSGNFIGSVPNMPGGNYYVGFFISSIGDGYFGNNDAYDATTITTRPANDSCANATVVGSGSYSGDTSFATLDGSCSCVFTTNRDLWYAFTPPCSGYYRIDTCNSGFDTVLSVHDGCPGTSGNTVECDDDNGGPGGALGCSSDSLHSAMNVFLNSTHTYRIRVAGYSTSNFGAYTLTISSVLPPPNDRCPAAANVTDGDYPFSNCAATSDFNSTVACRAGYNDIWYRYTAGCDGPVTISTCDSTNDTVLMAYPNGPCPIATTVPIACDDDLCFGPNVLGSIITFGASSGQVFLVRLAGFSTGGSPGGGMIHFECMSPCSACPADYNQDGGIDGSDVQAFFADWEGGTGCADVNQDGGIDGSDVQFFYDQWEAGSC